MEPVQRTETLAEQAYRSLRAALLDRTLSAGTPLTIQEIARRLGVSATPAREALQKLRDAGLVSFEPNNRVVVVNPTEQRIREAFELREALEAMTAMLSAARATPAQIAEIKEHAAATLNAAENGDEAEYRRRDTAFHGVLAQAAGNERLRQSVASARDLAWVLRETVVGSLRFMVECSKDHVAIAEAISAQDGPGADAAMRRHVRRVLESSLDDFDDSSDDDPAVDTPSSRATRTQLAST